MTKTEEDEMKLVVVVRLVSPGSAQSASSFHHIRTSSTYDHKISGFRLPAAHDAYDAHYKMLCLLYVP
jgi:hypothetical protein